VILEAIHSAGVIHRDIKPENILWYEDRPYLVDFNAATLLEVAESSNTTTIETCEYMAPEYQIQKRSSRASDIFSVGCIIAEALTGLSPTGMYSLADSRIVWRDFLEVNSTISDSFAEVIDQMLSPDPATRFSTVAEVQAALEDPEFKSSEVEIDTFIGVSTEDIKVFARQSENESAIRIIPKVTSTKCHDGQVTALCWTPDGLSLITGSDDGTMAVIAPENNDVRHILHAVMFSAFEKS
jgi:serine/threonine protein kinase